MEIYRLINIAQPSDYHEIRETRYVGFTGLVISPDQSSFLLEVDHSVQVTVNGESVIDLIQLKTGDLLTVGKDSYVFLAPRGAYIRNEVENSAYLESLGPLVCPQPAAPITEPSGAANPKRQSVSWAGILAGRKFLPYLVCSFVAVGMSWAYLSSFAKPESLDASTDVVAVGPEVPSKLEPEPSGAAAPEKEPAPKDDQTNPPVVEKQPPPSRPVVIPKVSGPKIPPERLRQIEARIAEYKLEARFDPNGSKRRLKALLKDVPNGHPVRQQILAAMGMVTH